MFILTLVISLLWYGFVFCLTEASRKAHPVELTDDELALALEQVDPSVPPPTPHETSHGELSVLHFS